MPNGSNCPLYIVTGASGVGKSALCREMAKIQSGYIVLDSDLLWDEIYNTPEDGYRRYRETWMTLCAAISDAGHPVVLFGCATPGQFEACDARRLFTEIRTIALVARPEILTARLRQGRLIDDENWIRGSLDFNDWLVGHADTSVPPMRLLDTSLLTPQKAAEQADRWISSW